MRNVLFSVFLIVMSMAGAVITYNLLFTGFDRATENGNGNVSPFSYSQDSNSGQDMNFAPRGGLLETAGEASINATCIAYNDYCVEITNGLALDMDSVNSTGNYMVNGGIFYKPDYVPRSTH